LAWSLGGSRAAIKGWEQGQIYMALSYRKTMCFEQGNDIVELCFLKQANWVD
jgi:hypothetical protein